MWRLLFISILHFALFFPSIGLPRWSSNNSSRVAIPTSSARCRSRPTRATQPFSGPCLSRRWTTGRPCGAAPRRAPRQPGPSSNNNNNNSSRSRPAYGRLNLPSLNPSKKFSAWREKKLVRYGRIYFIHACSDHFSKENCVLVYKISDLGVFQKKMIFQNLTRVTPISCQFD